MSPDGKLIAYVTNRTGQNEVYVRRVPSGADEVRVSVNGGNEPVWSPDGRELFYRTGPQTREYMMMARLGDGARLEVTRRDTLFRDVWGGSTNRANYDVFPDGSAFVMMRNVDPNETQVRSRLIVMMNWHLRSRTRNDPTER